MPKSFASLDTDFILALEGGFTGCQAAIDIIGKAGYHFLVPPVVEESLFWISVNGQNETVAGLAKGALGGLATYNILKDDLNGMDKLLTRQWAEKWVEQALCPTADCNDYLVVTESAHLGANLLLTSNETILSGEQKIRHALLDAHFNNIGMVDFRQFI